MQQALLGARAVGSPNLRRAPARLVVAAQAGQRKPYSADAAGSAARRSRAAAFRQPGSAGSDGFAGAKEKEPFDVELTVLFGLPTLVLLLPFVIQEPAAAMLFSPLLLFIPGPRDIARHFASDLFTGFGRARQFMSKAEQPRRTGSSSSYSSDGAWQQAAPPPPPPPPYHSQQQAYSTPAEQPYEEAAPWQGVSRAAPWQGAGPAAEPYSGRQPTPGARFNSASSPPEYVYEEFGRPSPRGPGTAGPARSVAAGAAGGSGGGRVVRGSSRGRVGIDMEAGGGTQPVFMRVVFLALPFLRSWGGYL